jgi:ATP-dependent DNA ligase
LSGLSLRPGAIKATQEKQAAAQAAPAPHPPAPKRAPVQCVNRAQEFVIGGFIPGAHGIDSIIVGYYRGKDLVYVARVRNGFVPATRRMVYEKRKPLVTDKCPFINLPETGRARWGEILDAEKMKKCVWVRPKLVAVIAFLEWPKETGCGIPSLWRYATTRIRERLLRKHRLRSITSKLLLSRISFPRAADCIYLASAA